MAASAHPQEATIDGILNEIRTKLLKEKFAGECEINDLVQKIREEIQKINAKAQEVILKQQLRNLLVDMENMEIGPSNNTWKTCFFIALKSGSSKEDGLDVTQKKKVMEDLEDVADKAKPFNEERERRSNRNKFFYAWDEELKMVEREKEKEEIIDQLMLLSRSGNEASPVPVIITIAGLAGIGKTKLARHVCQDKKVKQKVGLPAWVIGTSCDTFNSDSVTKEAIKSVVPLVTPSSTRENLDIVVILDDWRVEFKRKHLKELQKKLKENWRKEIEDMDPEKLQSNLKENWIVDIEDMNLKELRDKLKEVRTVEIEGMDLKNLQDKIKEDWTIDPEELLDKLKEDQIVDIEGIGASLDKLKEVRTFEIEDMDLKALQNKLKKDCTIDLKELLDKLKEDRRVEIEGMSLKALQDKLKENCKIEIEGMDFWDLEDELEEAWTDEIEGMDLKAWQDKLKEARPRVAAIMITTRSCLMDMAKNIAASPVKSYALPGLNEKESESLLKKICGPVVPFPSAGDNWSIAKFVGHCRGVPRALSTMARHCFPSFQLTELMEELICSYYDEGLHHLCFTYCSLFPQDYLFDGERLIHLWMAEGFLNPSTSSSSGLEQGLEEIGRGHLRDLVERSIFQDVKKDELGQVISCRMHPLMHDMAKFMADRENVTVDPKGHKVHQNVLRASFDLRLHFPRGIPAPLFDKKKELTSILFFAKTKSSLHMVMNMPVLENIFKSFDKLCVLDLRDLGIATVPSSIGELNDLQYLDLSHNDIEKLPDSIVKLSKLQTLKLSRCYSLKELPKDFKNLAQLKHLDMEGCLGLTRMPCEMNRLSFLQTLSAFVVSQNSPTRDLQELAKLNNLRGYLEILYLDRVQQSNIRAENEDHGQQSNVSAVQQSNVNVENEDRVQQSNVSEETKYLKEKNEKGKSFFTSGLFFAGRPFFSSISKLHVHNCPQLRWMPSYPCLDKVQKGSTSFGKEMVLEGCSSNLLLDTKFPFIPPSTPPSFIPLENLHIKNCKYLENLSNVFQYLSSLQRLTIENCPKINLDGESNLWPPQRQCEGNQKTNPDEESNPWKGLESLRFLTLKEIPNLRSLSFGENVTTLRELTLENCNGLTSISRSIGKITLLRRLVISKCNNLKSLPIEMKELTSLRTLLILDCAMLLPRCQRETGDDWPQISHIKHIQVK